VEWSITAASFAGFVLIFALFAKLIPGISVWEMVEENKEAEERPPELTESRFNVLEGRGR
jgi:hypothetical protein